MRAARAGLLAAAAPGAAACRCRQLATTPAAAGGASGRAPLTDVVLGKTSTVSVLTGKAPAAAAAGAGKYKGASLDRRSGKWKAVITVNKKQIDLGLFDDAKAASDAYFAAKAVYADQQYKRKPRAAAAAPAAAAQDGADAAAVEVEEVTIPAMVIDLDASSSSSDEEAAGAAAGATAISAGGGAADRRVSAKYRGVIQEGAGATMWEAVVLANGREISGGEYDTEEEAARAYDALARMYLGEDAPTNFPVDAYTSWVPPEQVVHTGQIDTKPGVPLELGEVMEALRQERGVDVASVDLRGKSDLAEHLVFVTGTSVAHMRRMADMVSRALRKRRLPGVDPTVEARDMDDWMVVDCGNIVVNVFDSEAREVFDLEKMYTEMKPGEDPSEGLTYEEWLQRNPIPEKWLKRLERDEEELEAAQRLNNLR